MQVWDGERGGDKNKIQVTLWAAGYALTWSRDLPLQKTAEKFGNGSKTPAVGFSWRGKKKSCPGVFAHSLFLPDFALFSHLVFYASGFPGSSIHAHFALLS